jgi:HD-GYP domain-containing protein (c-di-GMP phosphodiesterase class II)
LALLLDLGQAFHSTLDLDPLLVSILRQVQSAARSEEASLWLLDEAQDRLICTHAEGPESNRQVGFSMPVTDLLGADIWASARSLKIDDIASQAGARKYLADLARGGARNLIVAGLVAHGERLGALVVANKRGRPSFSKADEALVAALAGPTALAIKNARLYEQQRRNHERQRLSEQISRHMQQTLDTEVLIPLVLQEVNKAIDAEAQSLWLLNRETGLIVCHYATGPEADAIKKVGVPLGTGVVGSSVERQAAILVADAQNDDLVFRAADQQTGFVTRSLLCVPLVRQGKAIGAIEAVNKRSGGPFTKDDLELLRNIADSAALSIENARLYADLSASYDSTLDALMSALDSRDRETEGHSRRVLEYTARLAQALGLGAAEIGTIRRGALIHDIGKISIPDAILKKPGPLDHEERRIMQQHPLTGYEMLFGIPHLKDELSIVLAHHERWDGRGYPFGLAGEAIPLAARLFAVSDTFDAVTSDRPYRRARSCEEALSVIADEKGRQFDPAAVEAFLAIPPGEWEVIRSGVVAGLARRRASRDEQVRRGQMKASGLDRELPRPPL